MQCSAVQCSAVQCSAVQFIAVLCSALQGFVLQHSTGQSRAVYSNAVYCILVLCYTVHWIIIKCLQSPDTFLGFGGGTHQRHIPTDRQTDIAGTRLNLPRDRCCENPAYWRHHLCDDEKKCRSYSNNLWLRENLLNYKSPLVSNQKWHQRDKQHSDITTYILITPRGCQWK